jgi:hypothetical protein
VRPPGALTLLRRVNPADDSENIRAARRAPPERYLRIAILSGTSAAYGGIGASIANWRFPITEFNMIAFGLVSAALIIGGLLPLRVAHFSRSSMSLRE